MKYFCVSDIHGYFAPLMDALEEAGFDRSNPDHTLIACGDHFDRGLQPREVMEFLMDLPRKVLIFGNHDSLIRGCCMRGFFYGHDYHNGTAQTVIDLTDGFDAEFRKSFGKAPNMLHCCREAYRILKPFYDQCVDYHETEKHIFVHSWIPVESQESDSGDVTHRHLPDWRNADHDQWERAGWVNPFTMAKLGLQTDKTIVCGHWHCSAGWASAEGRSEFGADACFAPYHGDGFIAIDACTCRTGKVNVLVIEDEPL